MFRRGVFVLSVCVVIAGCNSTPCVVNTLDETDLNKAQLSRTLQILASDDMDGRKAGSEGSENAQRFIVEQMRAANIKPYNDSYRQKFNYRNKTGVNIVGYVQGKTYPNHFIAISAHYDHLGNKQSKIYKGADDNASGVAALIEIGRSLAINPPEHSVILLATDAEEPGLFGAKAFIDSNPTLVSNIKLNLNLDMIAQDKGKNRLYLAGSQSSEFLKRNYTSFINGAYVCMKVGHDNAVLKGYGGSQAVDWKNASDHAEFRRAGIPYLFFSVDLHPYYHTPKDTFESIDINFYWASVNSIYNTFRIIDSHNEF